MKFIKLFAAVMTVAVLSGSCSKDDDIDLNNEFSNEQEISGQVDEDIFVPLDKVTEFANLFFNKLTISNVSTKSGSTSVETLSESGNPLKCMS